MRPSAGTGLREAHAHLPHLGLALSLTNLGASRDRAEAIEAIARAAEGVPSGGWLLCGSLRPEAWPDEPRDGTRWPTRGELDAVTRGPCVIMSFDHHAVLANTAALRRAFAAGALRPGAPDPPGGVIVRDRAGEPTGLLLESAAWQAWNAAPQPGEGERAAQVESALAHLAGHGFDEVHDLKSPAWLGPLLARLEASGRLPLRVRLYPLLEDLRGVAGSRGAWEGDRVRLAGVKCFADGTINSRTAFMLSPYGDPIPGAPRGQALMSVEALGGAIDAATAAGLELAVHAIGDGAVRNVLDAAAGRRGSGARIRVEHCELIDEGDVGRFAPLGLTASVQPCHLLADVEALRRLLPRRLDRVLPLRDLIASGLEPGRTLLFGSDVPIVRADPADSIQAAVHRRRAGDPPGAAIAPEQAIDEATAWRCFRAEG